jgi:hypothetical protein
MSQRVARGIWPHPPLKFSYLVNHLAEVIKEEKWFPVEWEPIIPGEPIREGGIIERRSKKRYKYRWQMHSSTTTITLADKGEKVFRSPKVVAEYYLKIDLHLPGDLDGWEVVE